jgi:hypothetical protein
MTGLNMTMRTQPSPLVRSMTGFKPINEIPTLRSSQKYDWVKPDNEIPTLPSSQKYDWVKPDNEITTVPSSQKYDWAKPEPSHTSDLRGGLGSHCQV